MTRAQEAILVVLLVWAVAATAFGAHMVTEIQELKDDSVCFHAAWSHRYGATPGCIKGFQG